MRYLPILIALSLVAVAGCAEDSNIRREVELSAQATLPSGSSELDGETISVTALDLEPLVDGRYVVWASWSDDSAATALGALEAAGTANYSLVSPSAEATVDDVFVTEEAAGNALPAEPSDMVRLHGAAGGAMDFELGFDPAAGGTSGHATLGEDDAHIELEGLPEPPRGMFYAAWARWDDSHNDDHSTKNEGHDAEPAADEHDEPDADAHDEPDADAHDDDDGGGRSEMLGRLDGGQHEGSGHHDVASCDRVLVTLESERGTDAMSSIVIFSGDVTLPSGGGDGGGHMH